MSEKIRKNHSAKRVIFTILIVILAVVLVFFGAVRIYFRAPEREYYSDSEKAFVIHGLSDGFIAQGLSFDSASDNFFVTGYMKDGSASPVYIVSKSDGKTVSRLTLKKSDGTDYSGHAGGITVHGNFVYVAGGEDDGLYVFDYNEMISAKTDGL